MKRTFRLAFLSFFLLTYIALLLEAANMRDIRIHLDSGGTGLSRDLATSKMAENDEKYIPNLKKAVEKRNGEVLEDVLINTIYLSAAFFFLTRIGRSLATRVLDKATSSMFDPELVFLTIVISTLSMAICVDYLSHSLIKHPSFETVVLFCFVVAFFAIPTAVFLCMRLLKMFDVNFIAACYFSYFVLELSEIMSISSVNLSKMEKMSPDVFSRETQSLIAQQSLSDAIYRERVPGKSVNAALIGIGSSERIEVYGAVNGMDRPQLESVLIHEVGHSCHRSLLKKLAVFFLLVFFEMLALMLLYKRAAAGFACSPVSREGSFLVLAMLYFALVRPWVFILYNMTSQNAEIFADLLTKRYGYNKELAGTLYRISVDAFDILTPSWMYNLLNSLHPSIMSRIEYLSN